tara:strand:+ start:8626 stop:8907 length:282 start_codon:yes stop_codon:yes gene_type:complete
LETSALPLSYTPVKPITFHTSVIAENPLSGQSQHGSTVATQQINEFVLKSQWPTKVENLAGHWLIFQIGVEFGKIRRNIGRSSNPITNWNTRP